MGNIYTLAVKANNGYWTREFSSFNIDDVREHREWLTHMLGSIECVILDVDLNRHSVESAVHTLNIEWG